MIKAAIITRSTLFSAKGGDTVQVVETSRHLNSLGVKTEIILSNQEIKYNHFDILHFYNITRPADISRHLHSSTIPFVITPIWIDYSDYDRFHRNGLSGKALQFLPPGRIEYAKTLARWVKGTDNSPGLQYLMKGQENSIKQILERAALVLTNSDDEYEVLTKRYPKIPPQNNVTLGINEELFNPVKPVKREDDLILCVARVEGIKNQLNLIKAINKTRFRLILVGDPAPNQQEYYRACKKEAKGNIQFINHLPQFLLTEYYQRAAVHVLPSWYESCGLASLEAAAMGCRIVITRNGFAFSYFDDQAFYCEPSSPDSILQAINMAISQPCKSRLQEKIRTHYTWKQAAVQTREAYQKVLAKR
ncbi:MAG TPA: glycosyltransferase family 4 protein [Chitinophagaceae bacterium]|nr:glycosyltransferase family 4 protein [Chitinophagaceae bacterium]